MLGFVAIPEERLRLLKKNSRWRDKLKTLSDISVEINEEVKLESDDPLMLTRAKQIFTAFGRGFEFEDALDMLDDEYLLEMIDVKSFAGDSKNRSTVLKGRVIGTRGKIKKLVEKYSDTKIAVYGKTVCIMGKWDSVRLASKAVEMLLLGGKHSSVMRYIQENKNL
ncbi:hypothetical protein EPN87_00680 [archaeon]|nr:MAG: hypothetical protein EPN87_00680 [archaeon]